MLRKSNISSAADNRRPWVASLQPMGPTQQAFPRFLPVQPLKTRDNLAGLPRSFIRLFIWTPSFGLGMGVLIVAQFTFTICMTEKLFDMISAFTIAFSSVFCVMFLAEIGLRIAGFQLHYVRSGWFFLDVTTVIAGIVNIITRMFLLAGDETEVQGSVSSLLMFTAAIMNLRLLRIIRFFQHSRHNPKLHGPWFISRALFAALKALGWISIFLFGMILFYGMIGTELIGNNEFLREHADEDISALAEDKFYSVPISMLSVFQIISLDSWSSQLAGPLLLAQSKDATPNGRFRLVCMIFYFISLVGSGALVVINMLNAVVVERSIQYGNGDAEANFIATQKNMEQVAQRMQMAFVAADVNRDNSLSLDELIATCDDPKSEARSFLLQLGTRDEVMRVFDLLDSDSSGELTIEEFCDGFLRCKQDFNKFLLWQILERQSYDRARIANMNTLLIGLVAKSSPVTHKCRTAPSGNSSPTKSGSHSGVSEFISSGSFDIDEMGPGRIQCISFNN